MRGEEERAEQRHSPETAGSVQVVGYVLESLDQVFTGQLVVTRSGKVLETGTELSLIFQAVWSEEEVDERPLSGEC